MPTRDPQPSPVLTPPRTRVTQAWTRMWHGIVVDNGRRTHLARKYATSIARRRGR